MLHFTMAPHMFAPDTTSETHLVVSAQNVIFRSFLVFAGLTLFLSSGCATKSDYRKGILLDNGAVSALIRPDLGGRVMSFQAHGFENMLWTNKDEPIPMAGWTNHGGEKNWIGPQENWRILTGKTWPPPPSFDSNPARVISKTASSVTMQSSVDPDFNLAVRRQVEMDHTTLRVTSKLIPERREDANADVYMTNWSVAQLPIADFVYVHLSDRKRFSNGSEKDNKLPQPKAIDGTGDILVFDLRGIQNSGKGYFDADMFGLEVPGGCLLIIQEVNKLYDAGRELPERAQLYVGPKKDLPPGYEGYMEVEFTQPYPDSEQRISYIFMPAESAAEARRTLIDFMTKQSVNQPAHQPDRSSFF